MPKRAASIGALRRLKKQKTLIELVASNGADCDKAAPTPQTTAALNDASPQKVLSKAQRRRRRLQSVVDSVKAGKHPELRSLLTEPGWVDLLKGEFDRAYFAKLQEFVESQWDDPHVVVYPPARWIFNAFETTPFDAVRVVLLGQDPYHGPDQAMGLSFSVPKATPLPTSLRNIYKEIKEDIGYDPGSHGDLTPWARQGVLLLNTVLTVREAAAHSHSGKGWERLTKRALSELNEKKSNLVFFLWGQHAQSLGKTLNAEKHLILKSAHPSGLSAHRGFFGCKHFSKCNAYLESCGQKSVDWSVECSKNEVPPY